jgi:predicted DNA-binding WGR domain protein
MRRFYALDIEADLFGCARLMKQFGRIGARGRIIAEHYDDEAVIPPLRCRTFVRSL